MNKISFLVKNSSSTSLNLVLEPMAHVFDINPDSFVEVHIERQPDLEAIEIEYIEKGLVVYCGGIAVVRSHGVEMPPKFME